MPYRRDKKYRRRKRPYGRRRRRGRFGSSGKFKTRTMNSLAFNAVGTPLLGKRHAMKHIYMDYDITLNPTVGGLAANYVFAASDMYDPNRTGVGHQPIGFDQMALLFEHFTVVGSKITVTFNSADGTYPMLCGIHLQNDTTVETDPRVIIENGRCNYTQVANAGDHQRLATVSKTYSAKKFLSYPKPLSEQSLKGTSSASPAENAFYHVWVAPNSSSDGGDVGITVRMEFLAVWTEPIQLALS